LLVRNCASLYRTAKKTTKKIAMIALIIGKLKSAIRFNSNKKVPKNKKTHTK
jgi:hypothetical protein